MDLDADLDQAPAWRRDALCLSADQTVFFPEGKGDHNAERAKAICAACPVTDDCLDYALTLEGDDELAMGREGIWGGTTPGERRAIARARTAAA